MADNVFDKLDEQSLKIDKLTEQVANITDTLQKSNNQEQQTKNIGGEPVNKQRVIKDFLFYDKILHRDFTDYQNIGVTEMFLFVMPQ